jgi:hypothetical protein
MGRARGAHAATARRLQTRRRGGGSRRSRWFDDVVVEEELRAFTKGMTHFPTHHHFDAAGRGDLRCAVTDFGGTPYWAKRLGLKLGPGQDRSYSDEDAVAEARLVIAMHGRLLGVRQLRNADHGRLASVVQRHGGAKRFAELHGLA